MLLNSKDPVVRQDKNDQAIASTKHEGPDCVRGFSTYLINKHDSKHPGAEKFAPCRDWVQDLEKLVVNSNLGDNFYFPDKVDGGYDLRESYFIECNKIGEEFLACQPGYIVTKLPPEQD